MESAPVKSGAGGCFHGNSTSSSRYSILDLLRVSSIQIARNIAQFLFLRVSSLEKYNITYSNHGSND